MCFSAEASFTAAAVLTLLGTGTIRNNWHRKNFLLFAAVPLLFALQQFGEGLVWLSIGDGCCSLMGRWIFLIFAWTVWPVYFPLSIYIVEKEQWRRQIVLICVFCGAWISTFNLAFLATTPFDPLVVDGSLFYTYSQMMDQVIYAIVVLLPLFLSSVPKVWIFGLAGAITFVITSFVWAATFTSVWCFFAAILSALLYFILRP